MPRSNKGPDASPEKKTAAKKTSASRAKKSTGKSVEVSAVAENTAAATPIAEQSKRNPQPVDVENEIRVRAYQFFLERNGGHGDPLQDWFRAEAEVRAKLIA